MAQGYCQLVLQDSCGVAGRHSVPTVLLCISLGLLQANLHICDCGDKSLLSAVFIEQQSAKGMFSV